jgi:PPP family 3-phenylpropionic acid transporter
MLFAAVLAYAVFFFLARDFWSLLATGFVALSLTQAATPLIEAAALRATAEGKISYGIARGIGSVTFIIANIAGGVLIARFGLGAVVAWTLTLLSLAALSAWGVLKPDPPRAPTAAARLAALRLLLRSRRFLILVFACGLIQSGHAFYYSFSVIVWRGQEIPADVVGVLWAFGVVIEVALLWSLTAIERRITPEALILIGAGGGFLRWLALGFAPTGFVLWPLQALHALSFAAAHVGAMRLLYREAPESGAAMAQNIYAALSSGMLMGAATLLSGVLYDAVGARGYWAMAALALSGGALALLLVPARERAPEATPG